MSRGDWAVVAVAVAGLVAMAVAGVLVVRMGPAATPYVVAALVVAGLCVAGLLVLALTLSLRTAGRVRQLREVATELGLGDLSIRAPIEPADDLGGLGRSMNAMADRIARVLQANKDLLSGVSHELRSPLARIEVALELIRVEFEQARAAAPGGIDRRKSDGEVLIEEIQEEVELLERHISRLLEAQRVGVDKVLVQRADVDLDELVRVVMRRETHRLERLGFVVEVELRSDHAVLSGDRNALDRVVSTLVENVVQHTGQGVVVEEGRAREKSLQVETGRDELGGFVRVLDRGPGLTPEQCTRVFEAFFRTDASRAANTGGTGLGLYLVKRIVEAHGGTARAQPRPGGGLVIELRLPLLGQKELKETVKMRSVDAEALKDEMARGRS